MFLTERKAKTRSVSRIVVVLIAAVLLVWTLPTSAFAVATAGESALSKAPTTFAVSDRVSDMAEEASSVRSVTQDLSGRNIVVPIPISSSGHVDASPTDFDPADFELGIMPYPLVPDDSQYNGTVQLMVGLGFLALALAIGAVTLVILWRRSEKQ